MAQGGLRGIDDGFLLIAMLGFLVLAVNLVLLFVYFTTRDSRHAMQLVILGTMLLLIKLMLMDGDDHIMPGGGTIWHCSGHWETSLYQSPSGHHGPDDSKY